MQKITIVKYLKSKRKKVSIISGNLTKNNPITWKQTENNVLINLLDKYGYDIVRKANTEIKNSISQYTTSIAQFLSLKPKKELITPLFGLDLREKTALAFIQKRHGYNSTRVKIKEIDDKLKKV